MTSEFSKFVGYDIEYKVFGFLYIFNPQKLEFKKFHVYQHQKTLSHQG